MTFLTTTEILHPRVLIETDWGDISSDTTDEELYRMSVSVGQFVKDDGITVDHTELKKTLKDYRTLAQSINKDGHIHRRKS